LFGIAGLSVGMTTWPPRSSPAAAWMARTCGNAFSVMLAQSIW
jgi:hypothetical protein